MLNKIRYMLVLLVHLNISVGGGGGGHSGWVEGVAGIIGRGQTNSVKWYSANSLNPSDNKF